MNKEILKNLNVLYVEDDDFIRENTIITLNMLGLNVLDAVNGQDGLKKFIEASNIDLILTDISMPIMNGLEMTEKIKETNPFIPVVVTTAHQEIQYLHKAIELNIASYIMKPIDIPGLIKSLIKAVEPVILRNEIIEKNKELIALNNSLEDKIKERTKELEILASTDSLTGINNRRNFFKLSKELFKSSTDDNLYAVMIDVDNFKLLNDNYGHALGDEVLILLAKTIANMLPEDNIFGRLGGEEFAIVYTLTSNEDKIKKVNHIRETIANLKFDNEKSEIKFTISVGVSQKHKKDSSIDAILTRADKGLYEAKDSGRNKVIFRTYLQSD